MNIMKYLKTVLMAVLCGTLFFVVVWFLFGSVFTGKFILPQTIHISNISLQYYGIILAFASLAGYALAMHRRKLFNITSDQADRLIFYVIVGGFIGARLYHVISQLNFYINEPYKIFAVWNGGLSIYGVMLGGIAVLLWYVKKHSDISLATLLDWLTPSVVLGQIIGRFGNFLNYELYGAPTTLPWKMYIPTVFRESSYRLIDFFHPLFLYEAAGSVIILYLLLKVKLRPGGLFLAWLFLYNMMRFFLEYLRVGSVTYGNIRVNAIFSLFLVLVSIALYIRYVKPNSQNN